MRQVVETDQCNLRALPVVNCGFKLQMRKLDLAAARPAPLAHSGVWSATEPRIELQTFIPSPPGIRDLRHRAAKVYRGKVSDPADVPQRLKD